MIEIISIIIFIILGIIFTIHKSYTDTVIRGLNNQNKMKDDRINELLNELGDN